MLNARERSQLPRKAQRSKETLVPTARRANPGITMIPRPTPIATAIVFLNALVFIVPYQGPGSVSFVAERGSNLLAES